MIRAVNGHIAIAPFPKGKTVEKKMIGGVASVAQNIELVSAKVLFGSYEFPAGSTVYFAGNAVAQHWAEKRQAIGGIDFVMAPENQIVFIEQVPVEAVAPAVGHDKKDCPEGFRGCQGCK
jgi:hypothetical protein